MSAEQQIALSLAVILAASMMLLRASLRHQTVGLTAAFLLSVLVNYALAPALYLVPGPRVYDPTLVATGLGAVALGIAALAGAQLLTWRLGVRRAPAQPAGRNAIAPPPRSLVARAAVVGLVAYVVERAVGFGGPLATAGTALTVLTNLVLLAVCLWLARRAGGSPPWVLVAAMLLALLFGAVKLAVEGFLSFAFVDAAVILAFAVYLVRPAPVRTLAVALGLGYVGFSAFGAYLEGRSALRAEVWGGGSVGARLGQMRSIVMNVHPITPTDIATLPLIDTRLNQSALIGAAVTTLEVDDRYALGNELLTSLAAPIPRGIWWDKPIITGGNDLATRYTGIQFAPGTTIATGPIFEGFVNFGWIGIGIVMALWGGVLAWLDSVAGLALRERRYDRFAYAFLPAIALIDSIQNIALIVASMSSALVVAWLLQRGFGFFDVPPTEVRGARPRVRSSPRAVTRPALRTRSRP